MTLDRRKIFWGHLAFLAHFLPSPPNDDFVTFAIIACTFLLLGRLLTIYLQVFYNLSTALARLSWQKKVNLWQNLTNMYFICQFFHIPWFHENPPNLSCANCPVYLPTGIFFALEHSRWHRLTNFIFYWKSIYYKFLSAILRIKAMFLSQDCFDKNNVTFPLFTRGIHLISLWSRK